MPDRIDDPRPVVWFSNAAGYALYIRGVLTFKAETAEEFLPALSAALRL